MPAPTERHDGSTSSPRRGSWQPHPHITALAARLAVVTVHPHLAPVARACKAIFGSSLRGLVPRRGVVGKAQTRRGEGAAARRRGVRTELVHRRAVETANLPDGSVTVVHHTGAGCGALERIVADSTRRPYGRQARVRAPIQGRGWLIRSFRQSARLSTRNWWSSATARTVPGWRRSQRLGAAAHVHFRGRVSDTDLDADYHHATVFAMPARHRLGPKPEGEGFGVSC